MSRSNNGSSAISQRSAGPGGRCGRLLQHFDCALLCPTAGALLYRGWSRLRWIVWAEGKVKRASAEWLVRDREHFLLMTVASRHSGAALVVTAIVNAADTNTEQEYKTADILVWAWPREALGSYDHQSVPSRTKLG